MIVDLEITNSFRIYHKLSSAATVPNSLKDELATDGIYRWQSSCYTSNGLFAFVFTQHNVKFFASTNHAIKLLIDTMELRVGDKCKIIKDKYNGRIICYDRRCTTTHEVINEWLTMYTLLSVDNAICLRTVCKLRQDFDAIHAARFVGPIADVNEPDLLD